jgi:NADH dehydrogenase
MSVPGVDGIWGLGDCAAVPNAASKGEYSPPTAQYALRQGKKLGDNIAAVLSGRPDRRKAFAFPGLGQLCLVGHRAGVAELMGGIKLSGFIAWVMWRNIYLSKLPSWDRKMRVGLNWGLDLILPRDMTQLNLSRSQAINQVHYEPGDYIFRQGDVGNFFYVVANGQVEILREKGNQVVGLATLGPGEHFGEAALMQGKRRNASARAVGPVDLIVLGHDDFNSLAGTWLKFTESIQALSDERASDPAFASRLFEASQDFRTAFVSSFFNNVPLPISPVPNNPQPGPAAINNQPVPSTSPYPAPGPDSARISSNPGYPPASPDPNPASGWAFPGPQPSVYRPRFIRTDGAELPLNLDQMRIGRSPENHIVLSDKQASRNHALLTRQNESYVLSDQQTSNGTFVNGQAVKSHVLQDGDRVKIGSSEFVFKSN